jgi:hypothetical protein
MCVSGSAATVLEVVNSGPIRFASPTSFPSAGERGGDRLKMHVRTCIAHVSIRSLLGTLVTVPRYKQLPQRDSSLINCHMRQLLLANRTQI